MIINQLFMTCAILTNCYIVLKLSKEVASLRGRVRALECQE